MTWLVAVAIAHFVLAASCVASVLRHPREPTAMLAWIYAIIFMPLVGPFFYWMIGSQRTYRKISKRRKRVARLQTRAREARNYETPSADGPTWRDDLPADLAAVEEMGRRLTLMPATPGNRVDACEEANATYAALEAALRSAQHHIHLQYYIWNGDETGRHFFDVIAERARQGVECRVLLDSVGCFALPRRLLEPLRQSGVHVAFFLPLGRTTRRWAFHLRNHRKIAVIDGRIGFTGSQNIGDEYRGRLKHLSPWFDTHLRIEGPATLGLQQTFAEDWLFATRESLPDDPYFKIPPRAGDSVVQILPTGPERGVSPLQQILFAAVSSAEKSIKLVTPYFVPDRSMQSALLYARVRGVQVRLILPTRTDVPLTLHAARSFYPPLIDAGVEIFEFGGGVLHSKVMTVDDRWCVVGSANMDVRGFRLNFEITAMMFDTPLAQALGASIERRCGESRQVTAREVWNRPAWREIFEGAARLFTPFV